MTSPPSTRRELDDVASWSGAVRSGQHGGVLAERDLVQNKGAPSTHRLICSQADADAAADAVPDAGSDARADAGSDADADACSDARADASASA